MASDWPDPAWLAALKAGDHVVVYGAHDMPKYRMRDDDVEKVTATQIVLCGDNRRFRRNDGTMIGHDRQRLLPPDHPVVLATNRAITVSDAFDTARTVGRQLDRRQRADLLAALVEVRDAFDKAIAANG